ncbi:somatostatin receptor type 5-like [Amphiura filiformis]|uniref:somatostatin receptor type 5-like n=1 Tax=Amphiura filiformis TaxID=82378 RepID=UPI003B21328E
MSSAEVVSSLRADYTLDTMPDNECDLSCCHNISLTEAESYRYPGGQIILITICLPIIFGIGMLGNIAFIFVAFRIKSMRTITNRYLVNLAISDILFLTGAIGDKVWKYMKSPILKDDSPIGAIGCVLVYFISDMAYFASLIFVTVVSIDRYFAVCRPQDRKNMIKTKSERVIFASWVASCLLASLLIPANADFSTFCFKWPSVEPYIRWKSQISFCFPYEDWIADFATGLQTVPFFITFVLNVYLYICIIRGLDKSIKRMSQHGVTSDKDKRIRKQIAQMLVVNGVAFFCLLAPFELGSLLQLIASIRGGSTYTYVIRNSLVRSYVMFLARMLSYINSAVNPLIYTAMCGRYREAFKRTFVPNACQRSLEPAEYSSYRSTLRKSANDKQTATEGVAL